MRSAPRSSVATGSRAAVRFSPSSARSKKHRPETRKHVSTSLGYSCATRSALPFSATLRWYHLSCSALSACRSTSNRSRSFCGSMRSPGSSATARSEEHTSELQSHSDLVCRLLLEKKKKTNNTHTKEKKKQKKKPQTNTRQKN